MTVENVIMYLLGNYIQVWNVHPKTTNMKYFAF